MTDELHDGPSAHARGDGLMQPDRDPQEPVKTFSHAGPGVPYDQLRRDHNAAVGAIHHLTRRLALFEQRITVVREAVDRRLAELAEADRLLNFALHLRMHGENAPGGTETWAQFDRECEHFLRWGGRLPDPDPAEVSIEADGSYSPVRVPENTGKHSTESGETGTDQEVSSDCLGA